MSNLEVKIFTPKNNNGDYYVYLYDSKSQQIIKKFYKGINTYPDPEERFSAAEDLAKALSIKLNAGWSPVVKKSVLPVLETENLLIGQALMKGIGLMSNKELSKGTLKNYESTSRTINKEFIKRGWQNESLQELKPHHVESILQELKEKRKWSNSYYNDKRTILSSIFKTLKRKSFIKDNIIVDTGTLKKDKTRPYIPLTPEEQTKVINHFNDYLPNYNIWLKTLYHTGLRPKEVRMMKCSMVRLDDSGNDLLVLPQELIKTDRKRIVPIPEDLKNDLKTLDLSNPDFYVFGREKRRAWFSPNDFKPSPNMLGQNTAGHVWKNEVIIKLGIKKYMYSNKHKKANDSLEDGVSLEAVQKLFGHSTPITTEIYAQILELTNFKTLKEKARDFK